MTTVEELARDLLDRAAGSTPPPPEWTADLARLAHRRRSVRRTAAVTATIAATALVAVGAVALSRSGPSAQRPATVNHHTPKAAVMQLLASDATRLAVTEAGTWTTTTRTAVELSTPASRRAAQRLLRYGGVRHGLRFGLGRGYLIEVRGNFACRFFCPPSNARRTVLYGLVSTDPRRRSGMVVIGASRQVDLDRIGPAFSLPAASKGPALLPIRLRSITGRLARMAGSIQVLDAQGQVVRTVPVPASGDTSITVPGSAYYTVRGFRTDGSSCRTPLDSELGVSRIPVFVAVRLAAIVHCTTMAQTHPRVAYVNPNDRSAGPQTSGTALDGEQLNVASDRGHIVVLSFWGSWCSTCQRQLPRIADLSREYTNSRFVGVDERDNPSSARALVRNLHLPYPSLADPHGTIAAAFGLSSEPSIVILDPEGRVAVVIKRPLDEGPLRALIDDVRFNHSY